MRGEPLAAINSIYWINGNEGIEGVTKVQTAFSKLAEELAKLVGDEDEAMTVQEVLTFRRRFPDAFPLEQTVALAPIREASTGVLERDEVTSLTKWAARNLGVMAPMTGKSGELVDTLIDAGHLQERLTEAVSEGELETAGVLIALAVARGKSFTVDLGKTDPSTVLESMMEALDEFVDSPLSLIWNAQAAGWSAPFMVSALHYIVQHRDFSKVELDEIANNTELYFSPLSKSDRGALAKKIGQDERRIEGIAKLTPSSMLVDILSPLIRLGVPDAERRCRASVENLATESWKAYFEGKNEWIFELVDRCRADFKLTMNSAATTAAIAFIDERSAGLNVSERARLRRLMSRFNSHAEHRIMAAIVLHSESHPKNAVGLFKALGPGVTSFIDNHVSGEQLMLLVGGLSILTDGRAWLENETKALQAAFTRIKRDSEVDVREWFTRMKARKPRVRANWIEMMGHRLGLGG